MTEVVYSSMPGDESRNIFQSVLAKQSCSVASASSDRFRIELLFLLVSSNQEDGIMVRFARWSGESFVCISVCVWSKGGLEFKIFKK